MPDIQVSDTAGNPAGVAIDLKQPSSLLKYLKSELLHLAVLPDFMKLKDLPLRQGAPKPIEFHATVKHGFQLGNVQPEIDIEPSAQATIGVNSTAGADLFQDAFPIAATVPQQVGYVGVGLEGSLDLGISGSEGDLSFGLDATTTISMQFYKAFPLAPAEPTLSAALGSTISSYVLPADVSDFGLLNLNDVATVSGEGKLKISGAVTATAYPNPLASVDLPLGAGSVDVKAGATARLSAGFTLSGAYQVRARRVNADTIELSFLRKHGTQMVADLSASAGVSAKIGDTDLASAILGAISQDPTREKALLADLQPAELNTLSSAIKKGLDHSLQASLDVILSDDSEEQALFQYHIEPAKLDATGLIAVHKSMDGDLRLLTALEAPGQAAGVLAPGITMLNSLFSRVNRRGLAVHLNLIGLLNFVSVSELIRKSEVLTDSVTGDVTIQQTVTANSIAAIVDPLKRNEALRKVLFDSVIATACYRAGKALPSLALGCGQVHFAINQNTNRQIMSDYLRWLVALHLLTGSEADAQLERFHDGGSSTCVLRTSFADADCQALFFDDGAALHTESFYLEIGRLAMRELLDPDLQPIDALRMQILQDTTWVQALEIGPAPGLASLAGLDASDPRVLYLIGDMFMISQWARAMAQCGAAVRDIRAVVGSADPTTLMENNEFKSKRDQLQKSLAGMAKASKARFDEPWGMVSLFSASGSRSRTYGKAVTQALRLELGSAEGKP
ncbi:MAG TPA: hypothetical protein VF126_12370 [Acidobacteriaceae bacterium]